MKKIILTMCFAVAAVTFVSAQDNGGQRGGGFNSAERMAQMKQRLKTEASLTDAQVDSVMAIQQSFQPRTREIRMDQNMSDTDKQAKMKEITEERNKRFEAALGKDVATKVQEYYTKMQQQMRQGGGGRPQGGQN